MNIRNLQAFGGITAAIFYALVRVGAYRDFFSLACRRYLPFVAAWL